MEYENEILLLEPLDKMVDIDKIFLSEPIEEDNIVNINQDASYEDQIYNLLENDLDILEEGELLQSLKKKINGVKGREKAYTEIRECVIARWEAKKGDSEGEEIWTQLRDKVNARWRKMEDHNNSKRK